MAAMEGGNQPLGASLQQILKRSLQESVALARRRIRSKKGIAELQAILIDYRESEELAAIILQVIRLVSQNELARHQQAEEPKETVALDEYNNLEASLQKFQNSVREHIKVQLGLQQNEQQLKIYCEDLEQKNRELERSNEELLKSTKIMITNLKRDNQRLLEENVGLLARMKERESKGEPKEQPLMNSIKKARKLIESFQGSKTAREDSAPSNFLAQRPGESAKAKRSSLSSIRLNK